MAVWEWISQNWFNLLSAVGIIGGLWFTAVSLRSGTKTQRIANLLTITTNHREIWKEFIHNPELFRVLDPAANLAKEPVTRAEELFVNMVVLHISSVYYAMKDELLIKLEGLRRDIAQFLALPIARAIWEKIKILQNDDFVEFVEDCRRHPAGNNYYKRK
jgi:hypothetical protein